jgi:peptidoglycan/xylan/chitin deacetylase (PgdA/CDA1 family)
MNANLVRRLPILTYHSLDDSGSPISISPVTFREQMARLHDQGWRTLRPDEVLAGHDQGGWPERAFALTFDDGFENLATHGLDVLEEFGFSATVFVVSGWAGRTNDWPSQVGWAPRYPLLSWDALAALNAAGVEIGAHSVSHSHLTGLPIDAAEREIVACKTTIEDHIRRPISTFAYPYGESSEDLRAIVARHFRVAFTTRLGFVTPGSPVLALERIDAYYLRSSWSYRAIDTQWFRAYLGVRRGLRTLRTMEGKEN